MVYLDVINKISLRLSNDGRTFNMLNTFMRSRVDPAACTEGWQTGNSGGM